MSSDKHCCVPGCKESGGMVAVLHGFPNPEKDRPRFNTWLYSIGGDILSLENAHIFKYRRVCHRHFLDKYICRNNRISNIAVPTLYLPATAATGSGKSTSGHVNFSAGQRSQAKAGANHPKPSQPQTGVECRPATQTSATQRSEGKDQVMAKRALNETISPRGEQKRPRLDQSQRIASRSYAQAACASLSVAITCDRTGIISKAVSDQVLAAIHKQIITEARFPMQNSPAPNFNAKPLYAEGVLKLWCGDHHTLAWLRKAVSCLTLPTSTSLVVKSKSEIIKRMRCGIVVPDEHGVYGEPTNIGRLLNYQNAWIDVKRWVLLSVVKQAEAWFVVVGIPEDQIPTLLQAERRLSMGLGKVYVRFQGPNGRFTEVPRGWRTTTETSSEALTQKLDPEEAASSTHTPATSAVELASAGTATAAVTMGAVPSSGGKFDDIMLSSASDPVGDSLDKDFDLFAGLRLGDDEGSTSDGIPFVDL